MAINLSDINTGTLAPQLTDIAGLTPTDNAVIIGNGTNFVVESGATLKASLGLTIGTDVQAALVSGTNIKTINGETVLGSGNITITGGGGGSALVGETPYPIFIAPCGNFINTTGTLQIGTTLTSSVTLPQASIDVVNANLLSASGNVNIGGQNVAYTGKTGNTLTGCTGGTGAFASGTRVFRFSLANLPIGNSANVGTKYIVYLFATGGVSVAGWYYALQTANANELSFFTNEDCTISVTTTASTYLYSFPYFTPEFSYTVAIPANAISVGDRLLLNARSVSTSGGDGTIHVGLAGNEMALDGNSLQGVVYRNFYAMTNFYLVETASNITGTSFGALSRIAYNLTISSTLTVKFAQFQTAPDACRMLIYSKLVKE